MTERPPEYDAELEVCGDVFYVARTLGLARRLEQRFGPLPTLMRHLESLHVTQDGITNLVCEILRGVDDLPDKAHISKWVFDEGTPKLCGPLAKFVGELFVGNRHLREAEEQRRIDAEGSARNPTPPARRPPETNRHQN